MTDPARYEEYVTFWLRPSFTSSAHWHIEVVEQSGCVHFWKNQYRDLDSRSRWVDIPHARMAKDARTCKFLLEPDVYGKTAWK